MHQASAAEQVTQMDPSYLVNIVYTSTPHLLDAEQTIKRLLRESHRKQDLKGFITQKSGTFSHIQASTRQPYHATARCYPWC